MEFNRFVSYIYSYEKNEKMENCGFVKVEVRQKLARFLVHMYLPDKRGCDYKVYGFFRSEEGLQGILLGNGKVKLGNVDIRIQSNAEQLGMEETVKKANISIEQLAGVLIQGSDQTVYATVWDEEEIRVTQFQEFVISEEKTASRESSKPETNMDSGEDSKPETNMDSREDSKPEKNIASKEVSGAGKTTESNKSSNKEAEKTQVQLHMEEMEEELRTVDWDAMRNHGIPMAPFEEERQDAVYLRIEPQHLKYFPEHWWHLGRNSFLLHGYYNYRYLIIGKLGDEIILGIPGNYYPMEETVAAMFGFGTFRAARKHMQEIGCFGYWCRKIS